MPFGQAAFRRSANSGWRRSRQASNPSSSLTKRHFCSPPGNADGPAAFDLGDLADQRTDGARSRSDDDALSGLRFSNVQQTSIRAEARHAEHTECVGNRAEQAIDLSHPSTVGQRVILPSVVAKTMSPGWQ